MASDVSPDGRTADPAAALPLGQLGGRTRDRGRVAGVSLHPAPHGTSWGRRVNPISETLAELALPASLAAPLDSFVALFHKWNRKINLSAARSDADLRDHVADCLHLVPHLRSLLPTWPVQPAPVLDVGAGGGLPAVVVAICLPGARVTALEPVHKKQAFLRAAARELALPHLDAIAERLEQHPRADYAAATSRATLDLAAWLQLGLERVAPGGLVFGFEAVRRDDLTAATQRYPYRYHGRDRAIVALRRPDAIASSTAAPHTTSR